MNHGGQVIAYRALRKCQHVVRVQSPVPPGSAVSVQEGGWLHDGLSVASAEARGGHSRLPKCRGGMGGAGICVGHCVLPPGSSVSFSK